MKEYIFVLILKTYFRPLSLEALYCEIFCVTVTAFHIGGFIPDRVEAQNDLFYRIAFPVFNSFINRKMKTEGRFISSISAKSKTPQQRCRLTDLPGRQAAK